MKDGEGKQYVYVYASIIWKVEENIKARHRRENEKAVNVTMLQPGIGAGGGEKMAVISQLCALGPCPAEIRAAWGVLILVNALLHT